MKRTALFFVLTLSLSVGHAFEMAGVELQEEVRIDGAESPLVLNGAGIRKKLFFKVYLGSLYLPKRQSDPLLITDADEPMRMQMDILYSKVEKEKFIEGWNDGFAANHSADELMPLRDRIRQFNDMFVTLVEGDRIQLDYLPDQGTRVTIKGEVSGIIPGHDFNRALMKIWLGDSPVTSSLKKALLGK
ncbi:MAG: chalcone isomerase family protein [Candidatus Thiodiazotropha sp. (ex Monitilora ramsayi)]|nr:chalcone isomerase family protein [Candidatus Thiodiazotropha sp. (ex Monitilora ramsayi)]